MSTQEFRLNRPLLLRAQGDRNMDDFARAMGTSRRALTRALRGETNPPWPLIAGLIDLGFTFEQVCQRT